MTGHLSRFFSRVTSQASDDVKLQSRIRTGIWLLASVLVILVGQVGRELLPPDDLREVEIAREMLEGRDFVVSHFAGLPFGDKPPGFPAVVASAYWIAGGPNATVARAVAAAFALASLAAVFLLGRCVLGLEGGALAVAVLALSTRFCGTAHEVLLDNALTTAFAFTLYFTWAALSADSERTKHLCYTAAGFSLGIAFLMKAFVGPALFGAGFLVYLALSRRFAELRHVFRPIPILAFLVPVAVWVIPFIQHASPELIRKCFVDNHVGRAFYGYKSKVHPFYFYLTNIWLAFAPGSVLLPFAIPAAWKKRSTPEGEAAVFFLAFAVGPLLLLSLSIARSSVYLLPAYPAFALLIAWYIERTWTREGWGAWAGSNLAVAGAASCTAAAVTAMAVLGGAPLSIALAGMVLIGSVLFAVRALRRGSLRWAGTWTIILFSFFWVLWFTGPIARHQVSIHSNRPAIEQAIAFAGGREILLYRPNDDFRGAFGFYRNRTAQEVEAPSDLVAGLVRQPETVALLRRRTNEEPIPAELTDAAQAAGVVLHVEAIIPFKTSVQMVLIRADRASER